MKPFAQLQNYSCLLIFKYCLVLEIILLIKNLKLYLIHFFLFELIISNSEAIYFLNFICNTAHSHLTQTSGI